MHVPPQVVYLIVCLVVGWLGDRSPFGFWGSFLGAVLMTPVAAMAILLFVARKDLPAPEEGQG